jgi:hypothetical protein
MRSGKERLRGGVHPGVLAKSAEAVEKEGDELPCMAKEWEGGGEMAIPDIGNPVWLSKERGWERGKRDRCQNKGDRKSCPDAGAKKRIEQGFREK